MSVVLGIDVAKAKFHVTLRWADGRRRRKVFANSAEGVTALHAWLAQHDVAHVHAGLEATGTYGEALAARLHDAGHRVSLLNPAAVHAYARAQLSRAKTDRADADVIADYVATQQPPLWTPLPPELRELQALVRRLDALLTMQTQEKNRLQAGALVPAVQQSIETVLASLAHEIAAVRRLIATHIDQHPQLRAQRDLLASIPGIGDATAAVLLADLLHKPFSSARQAAAFAGVVPRLVQSGTWAGRARLAKLGPGRLRKALYFPAVTALRCNPTIRALGARLAQHGKPPMVIIAAAMRKLIHLAYGVLRSQRAYDPTCSHA